MSDHIQLENQRLENALHEMRMLNLDMIDAGRQLERKLTNAEDINRAAERLYRIITEKATYTSGGPFGNAVANLGQALRNYHDMDGGGR
jgi:hypothetical protein